MGVGGLPFLPMWEGMRSHFTSSPALAVCQFQDLLPQAPMCNLIWWPYVPLFLIKILSAPLAQNKNCMHL